MKQPKFKIGQTIKCPRTLYDETEGEIIKVEKIFQETNEHGSFNMDGLATLEGTIDCVLPYRFDGQTYEVDFPEEKIKLKNGTIHNNAYTMVSKFYGYAYTIKTPKMNSVFSESQIKT